MTKAPIKYIGVGEGLDAIEPFRPERVAGRMLQMGDVLTLVEKAEATLDKAQAEKLARKATSKKGMDLEDFLTAMREMQKLGPLESLMGMLPGVNRQMMQAVKQADPKRMKHAEAIVLAMTPAERRARELWTIPTGRPLSVTGRCRMWRMVISAMHCSIAMSGWTDTTLAVMMAETGVSKSANTSR
mgnify:CR=1 FL=1